VPLQCRITTEDPENGFTPDCGRLTAYREAAGFGIRIDGGTACGGALITPYCDSLRVRVTAWATSPEEAIRRMDRALREFRVRGVATNLQFVENVINHPSFVEGKVTTRFIDTAPELFHFTRRRDRASRLLRYIGDATVTGHPDMKGRAVPDLSHAHVLLPRIDLSVLPPSGRRAHLKALRPDAFARWMNEQRSVLLTDTRDTQCAPVAARDAQAHPRHAACGAAIRAAASAVVLARVLGRDHLRRGAALPQ
jgi:pyruvate carboxylase